MSVIIVPMTGVSDGTSSKWPDRGFSTEDSSIYLSKLATRYAKETAQFQTGAKYSLDRLPNGYALYGKRRQKDSNHVDRYLYGHPSGYAFRSVEEFYEHFRSLMDNGNVTGCTCVGCSGRKKRPRTSLGATPNRSQVAAPQPSQLLTSCTPKSTGLISSTLHSVQHCRSAALVWS